MKNKQASLFIPNLPKEKMASLFTTTYLSLFIESIAFADADAIMDFKNLIRKVGLLIKESNQPQPNGVNLLYNPLISKHSFYIKAIANKIDIEYSTPQGFEAGIYYILEKWGFKFLGYSDNWIEYPREIFSFSEDRLISPRFNQIRYFGTGGVGRFPNQGKLIRQFNNRNSLDEKTAGGHGYHGFYKKYKKKIDAYQKKGIIILKDYAPQKRRANRNINPDEPLAIELAVDYFRTQYFARKKKNKEVNLILSPPDNTQGQGKDSKNRLITNNISKWLWIGNEVAKTLNNEFNDPFLTFGYYAYGNGSGQLIPPSFPLENNIIIEIIPYAFQSDYRNTLLSGADEKAIKAWKDWQNNFDSFNELQIHDYWNITQWSAMLPQENLFEETQKLELWHKEGIKGANIESTFNSAIMIPHLWVMGQYGKGYAEQTIEELYSLYFGSAFKEVAMEMRGFYEFLSNWNKIFSLNPAITKLYHAYTIATTPIVKRRIVEIMAYMHFLVLHYKSIETKNTNKWLHSAQDYELWAKKVNDLGVIQTQTAWGYNYAKNKPKSKVTKQLEGYLSEDYQQLESTILSNIEQDLKEYDFNLSFHQYTYDLNQFILIDKNAYSTRPIKYKETILITPKQNSYLNIFIEGAKPNALFEIKGDNAYYNSYQKEGNFTMNDYLEAGVNYEIWLGNRRNFKQVTFNNSFNIFYKDWKSTSQGNHYKKNTVWVYIPNREDYIVFSGLEEKNYSTDIVYQGKKLNQFKELVYKNNKAPIYKIPTQTRFYNIKGKVVQLKSWSWGAKIYNFNTLISRREFKQIAEF